jgi:hypothetical protein
MPTMTTTTTTTMVKTTTTLVKTMTKKRKQEKEKEKWKKPPPQVVGPPSLRPSVPPSHPFAGRTYNLPPAPPRPSPRAVPSSPLAPSFLAARAGTAGGARPLDPRLGSSPAVKSKVALRLPVQEDVGARGQSSRRRWNFQMGFRSSEERPLAYPKCTILLAASSV